MQEINTTICGIHIFIPKELRELTMKLHGEDVINHLPSFLREFRKSAKKKEKE